MATVELHPSMAALRDMIPIGTLGPDSLEMARSSSFIPPTELSDKVERTDHVVPGAPHVTVRVHRPVGVDGARPALYSMHGGGLIVGDRAMDDPKFDVWCAQFGIVGVSVEYRLAPETQYPGAIEDCYAGLLWAYQNAEALGIDPSNIGITGVSAGGGLCAVLALMARDRGEIPVAYQLLDCPMLDDRQATPSSQLDDLMIWNKHSNTFGWKSYLGDRHGTDNVPAYAAAARAEDLAGLPPAYVSVGGADGFRDEDIAYALRLLQAGVPTELHVYPGAPHGVGLFSFTELGQRYNADQADWLRRQLNQ